MLQQDWGSKEIDMHGVLQCSLPDMTQVTSARLLHYNNEAGRTWPLPMRCNAPTGLASKTTWHAWGVGMLTA